MRYSEAIRLGGMMFPKCKGKYYDRNTGGMCVQAAALNAVGRLHKHAYDDDIRLEFYRSFPFASQTLVALEDLSILGDLIVVGFITIRSVSEALNDCSDLTREEIAQWVEKMEDKYFKNEFHEIPQHQQQTTEVKQLCGR